MQHCFRNAWRPRAVPVAHSFVHGIGDAHPRLACEFYDLAPSAVVTTSDRPCPREQTLGARTLRDLWVQYVAAPCHARQQHTLQLRRHKPTLAGACVEAKVQTTKYTTLVAFWCGHANIEAWLEAVEATSVLVSQLICPTIVCASERSTLSVKPPHQRKVRCQHADIAHAQNKAARTCEEDEEP
jgi:hypothetical protein